MGRPSDFVFAAKGGRFVTQLKHLRDVETAPPTFDASGTHASSALASGVLTSGALKSGALASGALESGARGSGALKSSLVASNVLGSGVLVSRRSPNDPTGGPLSHP
jgi:hypothetical protein